MKTEKNKIMKKYYHFVPSRFRAFALSRLRAFAPSCLRAFMLSYLRAFALLCFASILFSACNSDKTIVKEPDNNYSPYSNKVYEYLPAPGQFINEPLSGFENVTTPKAAIEYAEKRLKNFDMISLGGFGGYIVVGFDHSIENKGGYDFSVKGNAFDNSSEPGVVWVMQDENKNGLPDDTWYELKGSEYGKPETISDYEVTYYKPQNARENVVWTDNEGNSGTVDINIFHTQDYYYPLWVTAESYTLKGTCLKSKSYIDDNDVYCTGNYDWGYVDNYGNDMISSDKTKNFFKISNAVKADGSNANLQYIDFIKIQTAVNEQGDKGVGEASTEIFAIKDENIYKVES